MGLDMYLGAKRYLYRFHFDKEEEDKEKYDKFIKALAEFLPETEKYRMDELDFCLIYWRKANAIHKWFVDNVQDGVDECREHDVLREKLQELRDLCLKVLDNKDLAQELLPTKSGFFFGDTAYDEYYFAMLKFTAEEIEKVLELPDGYYFYYRSSW